MVARNNKSYDIVIAGGGMIGSSLALALAPVGLRVAMVEPVPRANEAQPSFDDRSTALSRSTQRMFAAMDIWDPVAAAATPIKSVHVSDRGRFGFAHIDAKEQGVDALGHVVINRVLGQVLQDRINDVDGLDILCPARIVAVSCETDGAVVTVDRDGERTELESRLVVAADGANSTVRDLSGIGAIRVPYEQRAIIGNLLTELPLKNRAFERFTRQGPLAILPLPDGRAGFVRVVSESDADGILALDDASFAGDLQRAFGYRLGELSRVGKRASYPLSLTRALRLTGTRVALVGNAAHGLHPAAAQGFNLGLRDVAALADCVADAKWTAGTAFDAGDQAMLERYSAWRRSDQSKLVRFTDGLVRLFGDGREPIPTLRNIGMLGFDLVPGVRRVFARHTMGLAGRLPRLSRGVPLP
jgi:2-octaprenyl-6-methoxyphenol hydroxylase